MAGVGGVQDAGTGALDLARVPVVDVGGGVQRDAGMAVLMVVPGEEFLAPGAGFLDGGEPGGGMTAGT